MPVKRRDDAECVGGPLDGQVVQVQGPTVYHQPLGSLCDMPRENNPIPSSRSHHIFAYDLRKRASDSRWCYVLRGLLQ